MTRNDILCAIQEETLDITGKRMPLYELDAAWEAIAKVIINMLRAGKRVQIPGVGTIRVVEHAECERINPRTGERFMAPACKRVKFKTSGSLHAALNPPKTEG